MPRKASVPALRRHKPSGRAVVTLSGKDHYCGPWPDADSPAPSEAEAAYGDLVSRWLAGGRKPLGDRPAAGAASPMPAGTSIGEALLRYLEYARGYYQDGDGKQTSELPEI